MCACDGQNNGELDAASDASESSDAGGDCAPLEARMGAALDEAAMDSAVTSDPDFTLLLRAADGRSYSYHHGNSSADTTYESASTSKLVSAVVILALVERGLLTLDTRSEQLLPFWQAAPVTLRELLSFTSGYSDEPACLNLPNGSFARCVETIHERGPTAAAGSEFYYASTHLQLAGAMAIAAAGGASWSEVFADWQARTGQLTHARYDLPSENNPRLAGGMHWTAAEYLAFLDALQHGTLLNESLRAALFENQRGTSTVAYSPALGRSAERGLGEDWAYGLGNWLECPTAKAAGSYDCGTGHRNSSPGAYGAYPFIDFDHHYVGILARQGALGTYTEGVQLFRAIAALANDWADKRCP